MVFGGQIPRKGGASPAWTSCSIHRLTHRCYVRYIGGPFAVDNWLTKRSWGVLFRVPSVIDSVTLPAPSLAENIGQRRISIGDKVIARAQVALYGMGGGEDINRRPPVTCLTLAWG